VAVPTTVSKPDIGKGLVRIFAGMVGILLYSCSPREAERPAAEFGACLEATATIARMSEVSQMREGTVLGGGQGTMS
jgi:hypothetical protein